MYFIFIPRYLEMLTIDCYVLCQNTECVICPNCKLVYICKGISLFCNIVSKQG